MHTDCSQDSFDFGTVEGRRIVGAFDGGQITSHAGGLLLGACNKAIRLIGRLAQHFQDGRDPEALLHTVPALLGQRIFGIALGYEDVNDHDHLRHDPVLQVLAGKLTAKRSNCAALAGKSTLNRLEHAAKVGSDPYHKITYDEAGIAALFVTLCLESYWAPPKRFVIDLDATHDPIHGEQEGRHFHGYYDCYCYLPLYIFAGRHLLAAKLRTADKDAADGAKEEIARIVAQIRARWPDVEIILRADLGFARDDLMTWCEENCVDYIFGLARNERLVKAIRRELAYARRESRRTKQAARRFKILEDWETRDSWSLPRRVIAKAEWTQDEANPRFLVTSLNWTDDARYLYEDLYCARGDMENRAIERRIRQARFPVLKTMEDFEWTWPKKINRPQIQNLFRLAFIASNTNVVFISTVGLGYPCPAPEDARRSCGAECARSPSWQYPQLRAPTGTPHAARSH